MDLGKLKVWLLHVAKAFKFPEADAVSAEVYSLQA